MAVRLNREIIDCFQCWFGCESIVVNEGRQIELKSPVWEAQPGTQPVPQAPCGVPLVFQWLHPGVTGAFLCQVRGAEL